MEFPAKPAPKGAVAGADESLIAYLRRMTPPQGAEVEGPGMAEAVSPYLPYPAQQALGTAKPLSSYSQDFPEMAEYQERARAIAMTPSIREVDEYGPVEEGQKKAIKMISPVDYALMKAGAGYNYADPAFAELREQLLDSFAGKSTNPFYQGLVKSTLLKLKGQSIGGPEAEFAGQTLDQREARRTSPLQEGRYMTSEGLDKNLKSTRAFNLLSAIHEDPDISPATSDLAAVALPLIGSGLAAATGMPFEEGTVGGATWDQFYNRSFGSAENPMRARVVEALEGDRLADIGEASGTYRSSTEGGYYDQSSWTNLTGMMRQGSLDSANLNTFLSERLLPAAFSGAPLFTRDAALTRQMTGDSLREVPIVPDGATPEETEQAQKSLDSVYRGYEGQFQNNYPLMQRQWNAGMDKLGDYVGEIATNRKVGQYSYPSPALNELANSPKYWLDAPTLMTLGATIPAQVAKGGMIRPLLAVGKNYIADRPFETAFAAGIQMTEDPYKTKPSGLLDAIPVSRGDVKGLDGKPADPNDPKYPEFKAAYDQRNEKLLGEALDFGRRYYPPGGTQPRRGNVNGDGRRSPGSR